MALCHPQVGVISRVDRFNNALMSYCWQVILTHTQTYVCTSTKQSARSSVKVAQLIPSPNTARNNKHSPRSCNLRFSRPRPITSHLEVGRLSPGHEAPPACKNKVHRFVVCQTRTTRNLRQQT